MTSAKKTKLNKVKSPSNDRASNSNKVSSNNSIVFALQFIGSLFYLYIIYLIGSDTMKLSSLITLGDASFWLPIIPAIAAISGIVLFLHSFTYIIGNPRKAPIMKLAAIAGFSFFALTIGLPTYFAIAMVGFILTIIAAYMYSR